MVTMVCHAPKETEKTAGGGAEVKEGRREGRAEVKEGRREGRAEVKKEGEKGGQR
jgi:hypothetical protein